MMVAFYVILWIGYLLLFAERSLFLIKSMLSVFSETTTERKHIPWMCFLLATSGTIGNHEQSYFQIEIASYVLKP